MKIGIDREGCVCHARCEAIAPDLYPLDDVGYVDTDRFDVPVGMEGPVRKSAKSCPQNIIPHDRRSQRQSLAAGERVTVRQ